MTSFELRKALLHQQNDKVRELLATVGGQDTDELGYSLLHEALAHRNEDIVPDLLRAGADADQRDKKGNTALHYAADHQLRHAAEVILQHGGDLTIANKYGNQPLWTAVMSSRGYYDIVRLFVAHGADVRHVNKAGRSPLDFARQIQEQPLIDLLISGAAVPDDSVITRSAE